LNYFIELLPSIQGGLNEPTSKSFFYIRSSKKLPKKFKDVFAESASKKRKLEASGRVSSQLLNSNVIYLES